MSADTSAPHALRPPASALRAGWADKRGDILVKKPVYRRQWFRRLALTGGLVMVGAGISGGLLLWRWHRTIQADLARQRHGVEAFVQSATFAAFAREADTQFVCALNFASVQPGTACGLLPEIAAIEKLRHQIPWALELSPLPDSTAQHPEQVGAAVRAVTDLLSRHGFSFDDARITNARRVFLRVLAPHARAYVAENAGADFPALFLDRRMQDIVLAAFSDRMGGTVADTERAFAFYGRIGPVMWRKIHAQRRPPASGK